MKPDHACFFLVILLTLAACQKEDHGPVEIQEIQIKEGWNSFSTYLEIAEDIEILFADHLGNIRAISNKNDSTMYYPEGDDYSLTRILFYKAYSIAANEGFTLQLEGTVCKPEKIVFILSGSTTHYNSGWTSIPYIRKTDMTTIEFHEIIGDAFVLIKDEDGDTYWPDFGVDLIDSLCPGESYQIRCSEETRFSFPANEI